MNDRTAGDRPVWWQAFLVWVLIAAFAATFATLALRRHAALATNGMDLGNVNQALWNTANGNFLTFTNMAPIDNRLALHVEPILLLCVPFYWLGLGSSQLLLILQAIVVALGAWPLFLLACHLLNTCPVRGVPYSLLSLVFPAAYLLFPALEAAVLYDFHAVALAPTFLLCAFYALRTGQAGHFALWAALAALCKEDMALCVAMLGVYAALGERRWRWGVLTCLAGVVWFGVAVFGLQPLFSPTGGNIQAGRYAWLGQTPLALLDTLTRRPGLVWDHVWRQADAMTYVGRLLAPTGWLAALNPLSWLPALPSLAINLLSDDPFSWRVEEFHYAAPIAPFVFISALYGVRRVGGWLSQRWPAAGHHVCLALGLLLLGSSLVYHYGRGFSPLARPHQLWMATDHQQRAQAIFRQVSDQAVLFAQSNLNPHVSSRRWLYQDATLLTHPFQETGWPAPDSWLFDVSSMVNQGDFQGRVIKGLLASGRVEVQAADDGLLLLKRSTRRMPAEDALPAAFYDFVRADPGEVEHPLVANFGSELRLEGLSLRFNRAEEVQPTLYFRALHQLDEDLFVSLYLLDEWGNPLGATVDDQPALVWYPTGRWQPGELVRIVFNTLPWYTRSLPTYRLALGVLHGRDVWEAAARLRPIPPPDTPYAVRLPGEGSLLELARFRHHALSGMPEGGPLTRQFRLPDRQVTMNVSLGGLVNLLGYDFAPPTCTEQQPTAPDTGCWLGLVLYWQVVQPVTADYKVFVHLVASPDAMYTAEGTAPRIWAQRDQLPDGGAYSLQRWLPAEVVADRVQLMLPRALPPGTYDLLIGIYHPDTGERLTLLDRDGRPLDDKVTLRKRVHVP